MNENRPFFSPEGTNEAIKTALEHFWAFQMIIFTGALFLLCLIVTPLEIGNNKTLTHYHSKTITPEAVSQYKMENLREVEMGVAFLKMKILPLPVCLTVLLSFPGFFSGLTSLAFIAELKLRQLGKARTLWTAVKTFGNVIRSFPILCWLLLMLAILLSCTSFLMTFLLNENDLYPQKDILGVMNSFEESAKIFRTHNLILFLLLIPLTALCLAQGWRIQVKEFKELFGKKHSIPKTSPQESTQS